MVRWMTRVLAAIAAYGVSVLCVIAGFTFRMALLARWPVAPYHCYTWKPLLDKVLLGYVLLMPLLAACASDRRRAWSVVAIGVGAFILATFAWSFTQTIPCSPL
jgi:hypothetical protein